MVAQKLLLFRGRDVPLISGGPLFFLTSLTTFCIVVVDDLKLQGSTSSVKVELSCRHSMRTGAIFSVSLFAFFHHLSSILVMKSKHCCVVETLQDI